MRISRDITVKIILKGTIGFLGASFAGILSSYLIFKLGLFRPLLNLIPEEQPLIHLYAGIVFVFLGAGIGGAVNGLLRGYTLHLIDPQGSRRRYLLGGAFAYGISSGILLVPVLLFLSLFSQYNPGSEKDPLTFLSIFTLLGALYGLFSGTLLVLLTLRLRYIWLPWLASIIGTALGGTLLGVVVWRQDISLALPSRLLQSIVFLLFLGLALGGLVGGVLALAYHWAAGRRPGASQGDIAPRRWQDALMVSVGVLAAILVNGASGTLVDFITTHTGTTTTSLDIQTLGVHWHEPAPITDAFIPLAGASHALSFSPQSSLAAAWIAPEKDQPQVFYAFGQDDDEGSTTWSPPVRVSRGSDVAARHPQVIQDPDGGVHILWVSEIEAGAEIRYSHCQGEGCSQPLTISGPGREACKGVNGGEQNDWPAIVISEEGVLTAVWNSGGVLAHSSWRAGEPPPGSPQNCLPPPSSGLQAGQWQAQLAALPEGQVLLVVSASHPDLGAPVSLVTLNPDGSEASAQVGVGGQAQVYVDRNGQAHLAWCGGDGALFYAPPGDSTERIAFPPCRGRPELFQDADDQIHLIWRSDQAENNFAARTSASLIYESIRAAGGWSAPAIVAPVGPSAALSTAAAPNGTAFLAWQDPGGGLVLSQQHRYHCSPASLSASGRAVLDALQSGGFHPPGYETPFCGSRFDDYIYMPNPPAAFSDQPNTQYGGFDRLVEIVQDTQYELLLSNMQWDQDLNDLSPGQHVVEGLADLYRLIKAYPERFPRGLTVRILLGNYPNLANLEWGDQVWNVIDDLRDAGIDQMEDPSIGWKLEVANFRGVYPHSHTKFMVIDGKKLLSAGFNISWFHLPSNHISGKGSNLTDLGMLLSGPVAQEGLAVFDDMWTNGNQLVCADLLPGDSSDAWRQTCVWKTAQPSHTPEVVKFYQADEDQASFALYRTDVYKEADAAYVAALSSAYKSIDVLQVNFSAGLICILNIVSPDTCTYEDTLPWMDALVDSVEQNHTRVRAIVENGNMNGLENRVGIALLQREIARRGLSEYIEVRFFHGRLHTKATLVDDELLFVGSQNFHYSSFGEGGLLEFVAATESPEAIRIYRQMFDYYWNLAIPADQSVWGTAGD